MVLSDTPPAAPFYLIIADHRLGPFSIEGPITDLRRANAMRPSPE